jgi:hypothetical protein
MDLGIHRRKPVRIQRELREEIRTILVDAAEPLAGDRLLDTGNTSNSSAVCNRHDTSKAGKVARDDAFRRLRSVWRTLELIQHGLQGRDQKQGHPDTENRKDRPALIAECIPKNEGNKFHRAS